MAFIDILGFKDIIKEAENIDSQKLRRLRSLLDSYIQFDHARSPNVPADAKPNYLFVSDSIILSAPLAHANYDGLVIVIMKSLEVAQMLLNDGYLVRGAIEIGSVWHENSNIFGSAYIAAYQREEKEQYPRIVLCQNAREHWNVIAEKFDENLCLENNGELIVDILNPHYLKSNPREFFEQGIQQFFSLTRQRLEALPPGSARSKWEWMALAINRSILKFGLNMESFDKLPLPR